MGPKIQSGVKPPKFDRTGRLEAYLVTQPPPSDRPETVWRRPIPGPVLGLSASAGLIVFSVLAVYIYYPAPEDAFKEIVRVRAEAAVLMGTGHKEEAVRQIEHWDLLTRKLQVGLPIRAGYLDTEVTRVTEDLRETLEDLRDALLADDVTDAKELLRKVEEAYRRCRAAYDTTA
jgi:hypothetical protein